MNQCKLWVGTIVSADTTGNRCVVSAGGSLLDCAVKNNADVTYGNRALVARLPGSPRLLLMATRKTTQTIIIKRKKKPVPAGEVAVPETPIELFAFGITESSTLLMWSWLGEGIAYYEIERSLDGLIFTKIDETTPEITLYVDTGLVDLTHYWYRVRAISSTAASGYSNIAKALTFGIYSLGKTLSLELADNRPNVTLDLGIIAGITVAISDVSVSLALGRTLGVFLPESDPIPVSLSLGRNLGILRGAPAPTGVSLSLGRVLGASSVYPADEQVSLLLGSLHRFLTSGGAPVSVSLDLGRRLEVASVVPVPINVSVTLGEILSILTSEEVLAGAEVTLTLGSAYEITQSSVGGALDEFLVLGRRNFIYRESDFQSESITLGKALEITQVGNLYNESLLLSRANEIMFGKVFETLELGKRLGLGGDLRKFPTVGLLDDFNRADCWPPGPGWYSNANYGLASKDNQAAQKYPWVSWLPTLGVWDTAYGPKMEASITVVEWGGTGGAYIGFTDHKDDLFLGDFDPGVVYMVVNSATGGVTLWVNWVSADSASGLTISNGDEIAMIISNGVVLGMHKPVGRAWRSIVEGVAPEGFDSAYPFIMAENPFQYMKLDNLYGGNSLVEL